MREAFLKAAVGDDRDGKSDVIFFGPHGVGVAPARLSSGKVSGPKRVRILTRSPDLTVLLDNATRWNCAYLLLQSALRCRIRIQHFSVDYRKELGTDYLDQEDWLVLEHLFQDLDVFYHATLRMEGSGRQCHHGSI